MPVCWDRSGHEEQVAQREPQEKARVASETTRAVAKTTRGRRGKDKGRERARSIADRTGTGANAPVRAGTLWVVLASTRFGLDRQDFYVSLDVVDEYLYAIVHG
jgi:hypothetical protein